MTLYADAQKASVTVLAAILDRAATYERTTGRELPTLVWTIGYTGLGADIDLCTSGVRDDNQHEAYDWWVEAIAAEPVADCVQADGRRFLSAALHTNGIVVVVRTLLPATEVQP